MHLQGDCSPATYFRSKQCLWLRAGLIDFLGQQSRDLFRVPHAARGKQIAETFKGRIREHSHSSSLLLAEVLAKLSFLNVRKAWSACAI